MAIRSSVKTIVINDNNILLIKYKTESGVVYYELPGGGQELFEEMEEAAKREFYEETGYQIQVKRLAAIAEEIFVDEELRQDYPKYVHRIHHIFQAELISDKAISDIDYDRNQVGCEWISLHDISKINLFPKPLKANINKIITTEYPLYLGTVFETMNFK